MPKKSKAKVAKAATQYDALTTVYGATSDADTLAWMKASGLERMKSYPNFKDKAGHSLLTLAASQGKLETAKYLLEKGANINYKQPNGYDALSSALAFGHYEVAKYLISKGLTLQSAKDTKIKLMKGEHAGSEIEAKAELLATIEIFERLQPKPKPKPKPFVHEPEPDYSNLVKLTPESPVESSILASLPSNSRSNSESSGTSHVSATPPELRRFYSNRSDDSVSSRSTMGSLRYSPSPSLFSQLSDEPPIMGYQRSLSF
jgi:hypothetical protein